MPQPSPLQGGSTLWGAGWLPQGPQWQFATDLQCGHWGQVGYSTTIRLSGPGKVQHEELKLPVDVALALAER